MGDHINESIFDGDWNDAQLMQYSYFVTKDELQREEINSLKLTIYQQKQLIMYLIVFIYHLFTQMVNNHDANIDSFGPINGDNHNDDDDEKVVIDNDDFFALQHGECLSVPSNAEWQETED